MKRIVLIVVGVVVVIGAVLFIGRERAQESQEKLTPETTEYTETTENENGGSRASVTQPDPTADVEADVPPVAELSAPTQALTGLDGKKHNYSTLLAEINKLSYEIAPDDLSALMEMLAWSNDQFPEGMRPIGINAVKNDVLDKLLRQETLPEGLGLQMVAMAADTEADSVWRDYCVQFMGPFYERLASEGEGLGAGGAKASATEDSGAAIPLNELEVVSEAMFAALDERGDTLAGTALIGLENLARTHAEFDQKLIAEKAVEIASDETASTESRLTALRLSSGIASDEVVETARVLAQTGETVYMRSAAIVTLGEIGTADDRELLESYTQADDRQIKAAAKIALTKMDAR